MSGVGVGEGEANPLHLQLLVDYLGGLLGGGQEQDTVSKVGRAACWPELPAGGSRGSSACKGQWQGERDWCAV